MVWRLYTENQPTQLPTHFEFARSAVTVYSAVMASWAKPEGGSSTHRATLALVPSPEFKIQTVTRSLPRLETPEGWIKKVDRARDGKVWVGYFHEWETSFYHLRTDINANATAAVRRNAVQRLICAEGGDGVPQKKQSRLAAASWRSAVTALRSMGH